jgi:hypothetical protein
VLLDAKHRRWFAITLILAVALVGLYEWLDRRARAESGKSLTGGSTVGLYYGTAAAALMVYAGLLSYHRRRMRTKKLGNRQTWLRGHIWLGLLSLPLALCHSHFHLGGPLEKILWVVLVAVLATGVLGILLQQLLPRLLLTRIGCEAPYEQIPHLVDGMRRQADAIVDEVCGPLETDQFDIESTRGAAEVCQNGIVQLRAFYERDVRPFLMPMVPRGSPMLSPVQTQSRFTKVRILDIPRDVKDKPEEHETKRKKFIAQCEELAGLCEERRMLAEQERIWFWLHAWLIVHVPLSVMLLVVGVAHAVMSLMW